MVALAGILHPSAFQVREIIGSLTPARFESRFQTFRYKNLELGIWGEEIITNERKSKWALLDGSLHNYNDLKKELSDQGYAFSSTNAAELLVHGYDAWGDELFRRLRGHFACALFDEESETLLLVRDRIGKKNLYWIALENYWLFGTELKSLLASGAIPQTSALDGVASYLSFGFIPQDLSAIKGVNKLLPGHLLRVNLERKTLVTQYWSFSHFLEKRIAIDEKSALDKLESKLKEAVSVRLPSEGPIHPFLAHNMGSVSLIWLLQECTDSSRIEPCGLSFTNGDRKALTKIAESMHVPVKIDEVTPELLVEDLVEIVWYLDEPVADLRALYPWFLHRFNPDYKRLFIFQGWEETFAGHSRYFLTDDDIRASATFTQHLAHLPPKVLSTLILPLLSFFHSPYKYRILRNLDINLQQMTFLLQVELFSKKERKRVSPLLSRYFDPEVFTQRFHRLSQVEGHINPFLYFDIKTELPDRILFLFERLFPKNQVITPFLDHKLAEFVAELPEEIKFQNNEPGYLLKTLLHNKSPSSPNLQSQIKERPLIPHFVGQWRKNPLFRELFGLLTQGILVDEGLLNPKWIRRELGYHHLIPEKFEQLWSLLILEIWFRLFIQRTRISKPPKQDLLTFLKS